MKESTKLILWGIGILYVIIFFSAPYLGIVKHELVYNMTCDNGTLEFFNKSSETVCGEKNPLDYIKPIKSDEPLTLDENIQNFLMNQT